MKTALLLAAVTLAFPLAAGCAVDAEGESPAVDEAQSALGYATPAPTQLRCGAKVELSRALIERCVTRPTELTAAGLPRIPYECPGGGSSCSCTGAGDCMAFGGAYKCTSSTCNSAGCIADGCTKN